MLQVKLANTKVNAKEKREWKQRRDWGGSKRNRSRGKKEDKRLKHMMGQLGRQMLLHLPPMGARRPLPSTGALGSRAPREAAPASACSPDSAGITAAPELGGTPGGAPGLPPTCLLLPGPRRVITARIPMTPVRSQLPSPNILHHSHFVSLPFPLPLPLHTPVLEERSWAYLD